MRQDVLLVDVTATPGNITAAEVDINDRLALVNEELDRYTCKANMYDYALAVASGAMAGAIDALYVGEASIFQPSGTSFSFAGSATGGAKSSIAAGVGSATVPTSLDELLRMAFEYAQNHMSLNQTNEDINKRLNQMLRQPNPQGLAASFAIQMLRVATQVSVVAEQEKRPMTDYIKQIEELLIPVAIVGFLNWLNAVSKQRSKLLEQTQSEDRPKYSALVELAFAVADSEVFDDLVIKANTWLDTRMKEVLKLKRKPAKKFDVSAVLLSMLSGGLNAPNLQGAELSASIGRYEQLLAVNPYPHAFGALTKQAIPVLLNEVIVRTGYLVTHLVGAFTNGNNDIRWVDIIPVENRTVDRMMTIASMTLMLADTSDAHIRAAVESAGDWVIYAQKFVARYNYVAAGRAVMAVVREVSDEAIEAQLIHEKRLLTEARAVLTIERLEKYKAQLAERLEDYLVENLTAFFEGLSLIDQGLVEGDSDLVIAGNVTIQRVLGREAQFTSQDEFDSLMESDDDFVF